MQLSPPHLILSVGPSAGRCRSSSFELSQRSQPQRSFLRLVIVDSFMFGLDSLIDVEDCGCQAAPHPLLFALRDVSQWSCPDRH